MMLAMVINIALVPWGTSWAIVAGYATIILTVLAAFMGMKGKLHIELNKGTVGILILFAAMVLGLLVDFRKLKFNVDFIKIIVSFFCCYGLINMKPQKHNQKDLVDIFRINKLLALVYIAYTFLPFSFRYTVVNRWGATAFTMNMGNSNATSILVMFCVAVLCLEFKKESRRGWKIVNAMLILALMYTLILLQSRTAVACMIFVIACIWFKNLKFKKWYGVVVLLLPIIYFVLQILLRELEGITILNKELNTGRGEMFVGYIEAIKGAPMRYILGSVVTHQLANYHNAPIAIVSNFGFIGFIGYLIFWNYQFRTLINDSNRTTLQSMAVVVLFAFIIHSSAEASPMLGGIPHSSAVILIVRLAKDQFEEPAIDSENLSGHNPKRRLFRRL